MPQDKLVIRGAREHNLKNIDLEIPRDKFVVITGLSLVPVTVIVTWVVTTPPL